MKKILLTILIIISTLLLLGKSAKQRESVIINAPIQKVWNYVSDSSKASYWSVFFDHISPLDDKDGKVGAVRRCFRREKEETGETWDEETLEVKAPIYRKLRTYNLRNFPSNKLSKVEFFVHQELEEIDANTTRLTFASEMVSYRPLLEDLDLFKILVKHFRPQADLIISQNLENIKYAIENEENGKPPHAFMD